MIRKVFLLFAYDEALHTRTHTHTHGTTLGPVSANSNFTLPKRRRFSVCKKIKMAVLPIQRSLFELYEHHKCYAYNRNR